jgi:hypothetical protein
MRHPAAQIPVRRVVVTRFDRKMTCPASPSRDRLEWAVGRTSGLVLRSLPSFLITLVEQLETKK